MDNEEFAARVTKVADVLSNCGLMKEEAYRSGIPASDKLQIQLKILELSVNSAISMGKADLEKQQLGLTQIKTQNEIELSVAAAKLQHLKILSEITNAAVQAESIKRSVTDNAVINKTNAAVNLFATAANAIANNSASLEGALSTWITYAKDIIDSINVSALGSNFDDLLSMLTTNAQAFSDLIDGTRKVQIIATKTTIGVKEPLTLVGLSCYANNECEFVDGETTTQARYYIINEPKPCQKEIIFRVKNNDGEWIEDKVLIKVKRFKKKKKKEE